MNSLLAKYLHGTLVINPYMVRLTVELYIEKHQVECTVGSKMTQFLTNSDSNENPDLNSDQEDSNKGRVYCIYKLAD